MQIKAYYASFLNEINCFPGLLRQLFALQKSPSLENIFQTFHLEYPSEDEMQNMIIPPEHKYVLLLNPANDDLSRPEYADQQNQDHLGGLPRPQKQNEIFSKTITPNRKQKQARTRGKVLFLFGFFSQKVNFGRQGFCYSPQGEPSVSHLYKSNLPALRKNHKR